MLSVRFRSDEGHEAEEFEVSFGGNLDWYFTIHPSKEDSDLTKYHLPQSFRIRTSGSGLPEEFGFIAALLYQVGQGDHAHAFALGETLLDVLRRKAAEERGAPSA